VGSDVSIARSGHEGFPWEPPFIGAVGVLTVSGTGSRLSAGGTLHVGKKGDGTLEITEGGEVIIDGRVSIVDEEGASGKVIVSGTGSLLSAGGDLDVGRRGRGTLDITEGGQVSSGADVTIGL